MTLGRKFFIYGMVSITLVTFCFLVYTGWTYYTLPIEERFFHTLHPIFKPSGLLGHGLGIIGSLCMIVGVFSYMIRKRKRSLSRVGTLKNWLEFHIFLCSIGPIMVLFHTAFKFGGIVAISFWSMVAVVASGVIGRFIYNQIPRSIQGQELTLGEVMSIRQNVHSELETLSAHTHMGLDTLFNQQNQTVQVGNSKSLISSLWNDFKNDYTKFRSIKLGFRSSGIPKVDQNRILKLIKTEFQLRRKINHLHSMQMLFRSWHVVHLPFALIMLVIMIVHIIITLTFGYKWIF